MNKKKVTLIAVGCLVAAAICLSVGLLVKNRQTPQSKTDEIFAYVAAHQEEFDAIDSYGINTDSDRLLKAGFFKRMKETSGAGNLRSFSIMKTYDAFRIADVHGEFEGMDQSALLLIYIKDDGAVIAGSYDYKSTTERADKLTEWIRQLDTAYEQTAAKAGVADDTYIIY